MYVIYFNLDNEEKYFFAASKRKTHKICFISGTVYSVHCTVWSSVSDTILPLPSIFEFEFLLILQTFIR